MTLGFRCSNDLMGYCVNPDPPTGRRITYRGKDSFFYAAGTCNLEPASCDHYRTLTEVLPDLSFLDNKRPPQSQNKKPIPSYL